MSDVTLFEVGPRDGLQNEKMIISSDVKIELINRLSACGLKKIEAASFVSPKWVPQMADAKEVMAGIARKDDVIYSALTPNETGMMAALDAKADEVAIFAAASEAFSQKNINCSISESIDRFIPVMALAKQNNIKVRGYVSCVTHCPYDGEINASSVHEVAERLLELGCYEISLGDTIGKAKAENIKHLISALTTSISIKKLALHLHDTYGRAIENVLAGLDMGISTFDSSVAGLGGCPYAEGASGNVATETLLSLLNDQGVNTDVNLEKILETSRYISEEIAALKLHRKIKRNSRWPHIKH
ncbi:MAG: hydroxymethylglutaryl-CoA lyase [Emcibacteraceae bacterium]|nr:hydroxymethylglutaryl-CoA lyase [Emcibacteraceae bacterium]